MSLQAAIEAGRVYTPRSGLRLFGVPTRRWSPVAPRLRYVSGCDEYQSYRGHSFYVCGKYLNERSLTLYLRPRTGGGADVPLTVLGYPSESFVEVYVPFDTPTGIVYDIVGKSSFGETALCKGAFHPLQGSKDWRYTGITVNAFTTGSVADDPWGVGQWWGLNNGGANLADPLKVVNLYTGKYSTDGGATWSGGTIGGNWESGLSVCTGTSTARSWTIGTSGSTGTWTLTLNINGVAYTTTVVMASISASYLLGRIKAFTNGSNLPFADKLYDEKELLPSAATLAQVTVTDLGSGNYSVVLAGDWTALRPRSAGATSNITASGGTGTTMTVTSTGAGSYDDWTRNLRACYDYIKTNWSGRGTIFLPQINGLPTYYYVDGFTSHSNWGSAEGSVTYSMNLSAAAVTGTVIKGAGASQSVLIYGNQFDDRDANHTPSGGGTALFRCQQGITGLGFVDVGFYCNNASQTNPSELFVVNSLKTIKYVHMSGVTMSGPGFQTICNAQPDIATSWCLNIINCDLGNYQAYIGLTREEGTSTVKAYAGVPIPPCWDFINVKNSRLAWRQKRFALTRAVGACVVGNTLVMANPWSRQYPSANSETGGVEVSWTRNLLFADNYLISLPGFLAQGQHESVITQDGTIVSAQYLNKAVLSASGTTVVLTASMGGAAQTPNGMGQSTKLRTHNDGTTQDWYYIVKITKGTGVGQWRHVTGISTTTSGNDTISIDRAWDTDPDATSEICMFTPAACSMTFARNRADNFLYWTFYDGATDCVVSDNQMHDGGTIYLRGKISGTGPYFGAFTDTWVSRNVSYKQGKRQNVGLSWFMDLATPGGLTTADLRPGFCTDIVLDQNLTYTDAQDMANTSTSANKKDNIAYVVNATGGFAGATMADVADLATVAWLNNCINDVVTAPVTTYGTVASPTAPSAHAYGQTAPTAATLDNVQSPVSGVTDSSGKLLDPAIATDSADYP